MKKISLIFLLILLFANIVVSQKRDKSPVGTYQFCVMLICEAVKLNSDNTFNYLIDGDLVNDERQTGTWKFVSENKIKFEMLKPPFILKSLEKSDKKKDLITLFVKDEYGAGIPNAEIICFDKDEEVKLFTGENGIVEIPKSEKIKVSAIFQQEYIIQNPDATEIELTVRLYNVYTYNKTMLFKGSKICHIDENDKILNCYPKLKNKKAKKLFP